MRISEIDTVVVLAAGLGSRLQGEGDVPKPLLPVAGRPLILRVLDRFGAAGVRRAVVVLGHRGDEVRAGVEAGPCPIPVQFAKNPKYRMSNGLSVLAARAMVGGSPFFLSMSDHIFESTLISRLGRASLPEGGLVLATDSKLGQIYDMDDATKVRTVAGRIAEIDKALETFDAIDTGLFACTAALFDAIENAAATRPDGDCSLSDGVKALCETGKALVHDIGDGRWQDVDTKGAIAHAEKIFS